MILIGLLIIAAVCVVLGVVKASVTWLVASLIASVLAGVLVAVSYARTRRERAARAARDADQASSETSTQTSSGMASAAAAVVSVAKGSSSRETARRASSGGAGAVAPAAHAGSGEPAGALATQTRTVIVIDGFPDYHGAGCVEIEGRPAVGIPLEQAVEDGFTPCAHCEGRNIEAPAAPPETARGPEDGDRMVVVVDGQPDYHVEGCAQLSGQEVVEIPHGQAVEDGFVPCPTCAPGAGSPQVWVADGFPDYHRDGCAELTGHDALTIPHEQAVEDGFTPCARCAPDSDATPSAVPAGPAESLPAASLNGAASAPSGAGDVWVVDGQPNYHRADCVELIGHASLAVPHDQAVEDGFAECGVCTPEAETPRAAPTEPAHGSASASGAAGGTAGGAAAGGREVFVADGFPDFHLDGCSAAAGLSLVPLPLQEAVSFGFTSCSVCDPQHNTTLPADATASAAGPTGDTVLVVDGFPNFHRAGCSELVGLHEEPVPHDQALEDGFVPCAVCRPDDDAPASSGPEDARETVRLPVGGIGGLGVASAATSPATSQATSTATTTDETPGSAREVLVVDGYPCYHLSGCSELDGLDEEPVPYAQAVEDGFQACPVCRPDSGGSVAADVRQVFVVDGYPDYHLEGCGQTVGLDVEQIPYDQAVEDGFTACEVCRPDTPTEQRDDAGSGSAAVISGVPGLGGADHAAEQPETSAAEPEPEVAHAEPEVMAETQAAAEPEVAHAEPESPAEPEVTAEPEPETVVEAQPAAEGETAATVAEPDPAAQPETAPTVDEPATDEAEPAVDAGAGDAASPADGTGGADTSASTVWVVEGRPRFHTEECLIIRGQHAHSLDKAQAEQDGYRPCSLCQR